MGEIIPEAYMQRWIRDYRCSRCYGVLTARFAEGRKIEVYCGNDNCDGSGFVRVGYVDRVRNRDIVDYRDAKRNLGVLLGLEERRTNEELLNMLGF